MRWLGILVLGDTGFGERWMSHCRCLGWGSSDSESSRIFIRVQPKALPTIRNLFPVKSRLTTPQAEVLSRCVPDSVALSDVHTQPESAQRIADSVSASPLNIQFHRRGTSGIFFPGVNAIIFQLDLWGGVRYFKGEVCPMVRSEMGRWAYNCCPTESVTA